MANPVNAFLSKLEDLAGTPLESTQAVVIGLLTFIAALLLWIFVF